MLVDSSVLTAKELNDLTGWELKPEGACRGEECVPLPGLDLSKDHVELAQFAESMGVPLVENEAHGVWSLGPRSSGSVLKSAALPPIVLDDFGGKAFDLASLRGRKVLLLAWASW